MQKLLNVALHYAFQVGEALLEAIDVAVHLYVTSCRRTSIAGYIYRRMEKVRTIV